MLATMQVPEHDGPVIPATGQHAPIGAHLERLHRPLMGLLHSYALPALNLPPAQHAVTTSTDQHLSTRAPGHRRGQPRMPRKGVHALPAVGIPHEELPTLSAATTRGQPHPIGAPGHTNDGPMVSRQPLLHAIR